VEAAAGAEPGQAGSNGQPSTVGAGSTAGTASVTSQPNEDATTSERAWKRQRTNNDDVGFVAGSVRLPATNSSSNTNATRSNDSTQQSAADDLSLSAIWDPSAFSGLMEDVERATALMVAKQEPACSTELGSAIDDNLFGWRSYIKEEQAQCV